MDRSNHYEAAFESYLQDQRLRYLAVDERRRVFHDDEPVKSLDFVVLNDDGVQLMVDVKGRKFPSGGKTRRRVWESWSTRDDVDGLQRWSESFGHSALGVLVFIYELHTSIKIAAETVDLWVWRDRRYLLRAASIHDYCAHMKVRSPKWDTVHLPKESFHEIVRPFCYFTRVLRSCWVGDQDDQDPDWSKSGVAWDAAETLPAGDRAP